MCGKSPEARWSPSSSSSRTPTSKSSGRRVPPWGIWRSTVGACCSMNSTTGLTGCSGEQGRHCRTWGAHPIDQADELAERRGTMQCGRLHHQPGHARRQQSQDCQVRGSAAIDTVSKVQGHARPEKCNRSAPQHDTLRYDPPRRPMLHLNRLADYLCR
jgi:hypothetical protein